MLKIISKILCFFIKKLNYQYLIKDGKTKLLEVNIKEIVPKDEKWHNVTYIFYVKRNKKKIYLDDVAIFNKPL